MITIETPSGPERFRGELLGEGTSVRGWHSHSGDVVPAGRDANGRKFQCQACRWQEVYIYMDLDTGKFIVHTIGRTTVPGEQDYVKFVRTDSALAVREILTVRKPEGPFIPAPAKIAIAAAAELDADMRDVYDTLPAGL